MTITLHFTLIDWIRYFYKYVGTNNPIEIIGIFDRVYLYILSSYSLGEWHAVLPHIGHWADFSALPYRVVQKGLQLKKLRYLHK